MEEFNGSDKRELVEKFRAEYEIKQKQKMLVSIVMVLAGIGITIGGIVLASQGLSNLFDSGIDGLGKWLGGLFMTIGGVFFTIISVVRLNLSKKDNLVPYIKNRMREVELKDTNKLLEAIDGRAPQKKCEYCGFAMDASIKICPHCGANL